eukprot:TRINITY_DN3378_c0_g1_i7.p1 TRINITY_DN3378_c0_g1~~TRINITY_DN3378_c0_g1_i7.p1  ORF type:complete len:287 (+),score=77.92 TRINITY_DN3378_c0_g1_i7:119-862(+)
MGDFHRVFPCENYDYYMDFFESPKYYNVLCGEWVKNDMPIALLNIRDTAYKRLPGTQEELWEQALDHPLTEGTGLVDENDELVMPTESVSSRRSSQSSTTRKLSRSSSISSYSSAGSTGSQSSGRGSTSSKSNRKTARKKSKTRTGSASSNRSSNSNTSRTSSSSRTRPSGSSGSNSRPPIPRSSKASSVMSTETSITSSTTSEWQEDSGILESLVQQQQRQNQRISKTTIGGPYLALQANSRKGRK